MPPLTKKLTEIAIAMALTLAVVFVIIVANGMLTSRTSYAQGFNTWLAFVQRPDIIGTMALTALVTIVYGIWQQGGRR
jgi:ABC-type sulfate transport system permease subunit